ncbi:MAG: hypothetical protein PHU51_01185 [Candidatus Nanoarchaeia archaeon]|nr:hypothetical protein [Candidatus Nanoarchaeia archaeon]
MKLNQIIPNPFDKTSKLSEIAKRAELLKEGLKFKNLFQKFIFLIILAVVLIFFNISPIVIGILVTTQLTLLIIHLVIKVKEFKAIKSIKTDKVGESYKKIIVTNEYFEWRKSVVSLIGNTITTLLLIVLFYNELTNFKHSILPQLPITDMFLIGVLIAWLLFNVLDFFIRLKRYKLVRNLKHSKNLAELDKNFLIIEKKIELLRMVPGAIGISVVLLFLEIPIWIPVIVLAVLAIFAWLTSIEIKRLNNVKFEENCVDKSVVKNLIKKTQAGEKVATSVFGIMKTAASFKEIFKPVGRAYLGTGKHQFPENTLVVTNKRLLLVQVPVAGGNKIIGDKNYVQENFFFNRGAIREEGAKLIKKGLNNLIKYTIEDVLYVNLKSFTLNQTKIIIEKQDGRKLGYVFMDKEFIEPLKKSLKTLLKTKFIEK